MTNAKMPSALEKDDARLTLASSERARSGQDQGRPAEGGPLGNITKYASKDEFIQASEKHRFSIQDMAAKLLPKERVADCMKYPAFNPVTKTRAEKITTYYSQLHGRAHMRGLAVCGSVWHCPVCSARITIKRRQELTQVLASIKKAGYSMFFVTLTLQHTRSDKLADTLKLLTDTWRKMTSHRRYQEFKNMLELVGSVRGLEHTWSEKNGHHPHIHLILISKLPQDLIKSQKQAILDVFKGLYNQVLEKAGKHTNEHTTQVITNGDFANYISKWSLSAELTPGQGKTAKEGHYNPWQLLTGILDGDTSLEGPFVEYALAYKGKRQLVRSTTDPELHKLFWPEPEKSDQELAEEPEFSDDVAVLELPAEAHIKLINTHGRVYIPKLYRLVENFFRTRDPVPMLEYLTGQGMNLADIKILYMLESLNPPAIPTD